MQKLFKSPDRSVKCVEMKKMKKRPKGEIVNKIKFGNKLRTIYIVRDVEGVLYSYDYKQVKDINGDIVVGVYDIELCNKLDNLQIERDITEATMEFNKFKQHCVYTVSVITHNIYTLTR